MFEPGLDTWLRILVRRFRFVLLLGLISGILTLAISFALPQWYTSRASILPPREAGTLLAAQGLARVLGLPTDLPFSGGVSVLDTYLGILDSDRVARNLIEEFSLQDRYRQSTLVRTIKKLHSHTDIELHLSGVITVQVEEKDPQLAADLANAYVWELDSVVTGTRMTAGRRQRMFLQERVQESRAKLDSLEDALAQVQQESGITSLDRSASEVALVAGTLMGRRMALGVQIEMMDILEMDTTPLRDQMEVELRALDAEIEKLPALGTNLVRLLRDVRMHERLHEAVSHSLETARLEEVRETQVVEILDQAIPADRRSRPRKGLMAVAGAVLGAGLGFGYCVVDARASQSSS